MLVRHKECLFWKIFLTSSFSFVVFLIICSVLLCISTPASLILSSLLRIAMFLSPVIYRIFLCCNFPGTVGIVLIPSSWCGLMSPVYSPFWVEVISSSYYIFYASYVGVYSPVTVPISQASTY